MFIAHNSAQLFTVDYGMGPRTFVAHGGWTGSWELWTAPFNELSKTWRTVAYDHRGTGVTLAPIESISTDTMVDDLFAVLNALRIERCVLAAESAGAIVAVKAVLQQPQRFDGLVLVDALLHRQKDATSEQFIDGLRKNFDGTIAGFVDACVPEAESNSFAIRAWGRKILARASVESSVCLIECTYGIDLRPQVAQISIPTLILHGDHDVIVPVEDAKYIASQIPDNLLHVFPGAGHVPTMTRPHEVAQQINRYFDQTQ